MSIIDLSHCLLNYVAKDINIARPLLLDLHVHTRSCMVHVRNAFIGASERVP